MRVIIRGVKRSGAKLRFAAQPFAFCNYELSGHSGSSHVVTGAMAIEDLFGVSASDKYFEGCVMLEAADKACSIQPNAELFLLLLKRLKNLIYDNFPYKICAISYLQNIIHKSGYSYTYAAPKSEPETVLELLACTEDLDTEFIAPAALIDKAFRKIASNFEDKFSCVLVSKSALI